MRRPLLRNASIALAAWLTLWGMNRLAEAQQTSIVSGGSGGTLGGGGGGGVSGGTSLFGQAGSAGADLANATSGAGYSGGQGGFSGNTNTPATTGRGGAGASGGVAIPAASNVFAGYYVNPFSLGVMNNGATGKGTFNQPLYAIVAATANRTTGGTRTGVRNATTAAIVGFTSYGMDRTIPYRTELSDSIPIYAPVASALQAELRDVVTGSTRLNGKNIDVSVANGTVFLRGQVASADERRLAENLIRLTPGVRQVSNELTIAGGGRQ